MTATTFRPELAAHGSSTATSPHGMPATARESPQPSPGSLVHEARTLPEEARGALIADPDLGIEELGRLVAHEGRQPLLVSAASGTRQGSRSGAGTPTCSTPRGTRRAAIEAAGMPPPGWVATSLRQRVSGVARQDHRSTRDGVAERAVPTEGTTGVEPATSGLESAVRDGARVHLGPVIRSMTGLARWRQDRFTPARTTSVAHFLRGDGWRWSSWRSTSSSPWRCGRWVYGVQSLPGPTPLRTTPGPTRAPRGVRPGRSAPASGLGGPSARRPR
jgi:hypothetical protein